MAKTITIYDSEYSLIMESLTALADYHYQKSNSLKRQSDVEFHREKFTEVSMLKVTLWEQFMKV